MLVAVSARADLLMYPSTRAHDMAWPSGARLELEERPSTGRSALEEEGMWGIEGDGVRASPTSGCKPWWMHGDGQEPGGNKDGLVLRPRCRGERRCACDYFVHGGAGWAC